MFESRFKGVVRRQRERRARRRSVSSVRIPRLEDGNGNEASQDQKKVADPGDRSGFESRHSGPRDPTPGGENGTAGIMDAGQSKSGDGGEGSKNGSERTAVNPAPAPPSPVDEGVRPRRGSGTSDRISFMRYAPSPPPDAQQHRRVLSFVGVGAHPNSTAYQPRNASGLIHRGEKKLRETEEAIAEGLSNAVYPHYLTRHTTGRNAQFFGLSRAEREHLGGVEYRAISLLAWVVPTYFVLWQLLGCLGLGAYVAYNTPTVAEGNGINPWWVLSSYEWKLANGLIGGWVRSMPFLHLTTPGCRCWMQIWYCLLLNLESPLIMSDPVSKLYLYTHHDESPDLGRKHSVRHLSSFNAQSSNKQLPSLPPPHSLEHA